MNNLIKSQATLGKLNKKSLNINHRSQEVRKILFMKIKDSVKSILDAVANTIKRTFMINIRYIETRYRH